MIVSRGQQRREIQPIGPQVLITILAVSTMVTGQFLQPQSHLGRIMQSITSPLVIHQSEPEGLSASGSYPTAEAPRAYEHEHEHEESGRLQQAPSRQQRFRAPIRQQASQDYEDQQQQLDQRRAPSMSKQSHQHQDQSYQMGAYLGPSMDDKEINGAFNEAERDDERDSYDGPASGRLSAASGAHLSPSSPGGYPSQGDEVGQPGVHHQSAGRMRAQLDEDSADEDDQAEARGQQYGRLRPAASQYRQQRGSVAQDAGYPAAPSNMMAAANGYVPYGTFGGPVDLGPMLNGPAGYPAMPGAEQYNGDGSPAGYYNQARQQRQASSMMGYGGPAGYPAGGQDARDSQAAGRNNDPDDQDNDNDDDRA